MGALNAILETFSQFIDIDVITNFFNSATMANILQIIMYVAIGIAVVTILVIVGIVVLIVALIKKSKEKKLAAAVKETVAEESTTEETESTDAPSEE